MSSQAAALRPGPLFMSAAAAAPGDVYLRARVSKELWSLPWLLLSSHYDWSSLRLHSCLLQPTLHRLLLPLSYYHRAPIQLQTLWLSADRNCVVICGIRGTFRNVFNPENWHWNKDKKTSFWHKSIFLEKYLDLQLIRLCISILFISNK